MIRKVLSVCVLCLLCTSGVLAQNTAQEPAGTKPDLLQLLNSDQAHFEKIDADHWKLTGQVVLEPQTGVKLYADQVDLFMNTHTLTASGNVVFSNPEGRLSAERVDFDIDKGTGTFYDASGIMSLGAKAKVAQFGGQEPDVYFYGEKIDRLGARRYRITRGGFSTCVQPTPRWEVTSGAVTLDLDDYAIARNMVLHVKGVPLLYLPVIYYPISSKQRQTGFLLPTYGTSTVRGQALSNAFFWAIDRSQDATFFHDWFTRTGQGAGGEYRYVASQASSGDFRFYRFSQKNATFTQNGTTGTLPAATSYEMRGSMIQALAPGVTARARVDYFSNIVTEQLYHQNLYQATNSTRVVDTALTAALGPIALSGQYLRNEVFSSTTSAFLYGGTPRVTASTAPLRLFGAPIYGGVNAEYAFQPYQQITNGVVTLDKSVNRIDVSPNIRLPLSRLSFLSVNTSAMFRSTYYSRSADPVSLATVEEPYFRRYASVRTDVVGPVLSRIWDVKDSTFAERLKHVIEPAFSADVTTPISDYLRTPQLTDATDIILGGTTRVTYGVTNRLFYRAPDVNGVRGATREFITVGLQQTYYTNPIARHLDTTYLAVGSQGPSSLSPVALTVRVTPSPSTDLNSRIEYDTSAGRGMQLFSLGSGLTGKGQTASVTFSRQHFTPTSPATTYLSSSVSTSELNGRLTGSYALSWDISRSTIMSQTISASHMAQCCGWQVQFQKVNYPSGIGIPIPWDRRLNFSFVLAGLGTFSNFFGAFGGAFR